MSQQWRAKSIKGPNARPQPRRSSRSVRVAKKRNGHSWFTWLLLAAALVAVLYLLFFVLPRVEVTLVPETRLVSVSTEITLAERVREVDTREQVVPVEQITVSGEISDEFTATGERDIGEKARGKVTFINFTGVPFDLLVEDGIETIDGLLFTVRSPLIIPGATISPDGDIVPGEIEAELVALEAGQTSNVGPQRFFISSVAVERQNKIYGESQTAFSGGTSEIIIVASQEDIDKAQEDLRAQLTTLLQEDVAERLGKRLVQIDETFTLQDETFIAEAELDEETESFSASLTAGGAVYVYVREDLDTLLINLAISKLGPNEQLVDKAPSLVKFAEADKTLVEGAISLPVEVQWLASRRIDLESLKTQILGKREADARRILLADPTVSDVRFNWITAISRKVPKIPSHVSLKLKSK